MSSWSIEGYFGDGRILRRVPVSRFPFVIGRQDGLDLTLASDDVSRQHAELFEQQDGLFVRDLGSTNGTFVNRAPVNGMQQLYQGDVIHIAHIDLRVMQEDDEGREERTHTVIYTADLPERMPLGSGSLAGLLQERSVKAVFQAIVDTSDESVHAYEILGRGDHDALPDSPYQLFRIAESIGLEVELSELLRDVGVETASRLGPDVHYTVNTHPAEMADPARLKGSIISLRERYPDLGLTLEIHEEAVTDLKQMRELYDLLRSLNIGLAYDDFGAGQARLLELVEAPADYLKFDIALIRDLDRAPRTKVDLVRMLVDISNNMGSKTLAEGVSNAGERDICLDLGFNYIQGFYYNRPSERLWTP